MRLELGDTTLTNPEVQDETITYYLQTKQLTVLGAAAALAWTIAAKYAKLADVTMDDQLTRYSHVYENWTNLATRLTADAAAESVVPTPATATAGVGSVIVTGIGDCRGPIKHADPYWFDRIYPC